MRVLTIDADFSTRGLSLYLLGNVLGFRDLNVKKENCLADAVLHQIPIEEVKPLTIEHESLGYNIVISNSDVLKGGVPEERFLGGLTATHARTDPYEYYKYIRKLCDRFRQEYDYIIIDTRGGYDFTSAAPAIISDGFVIVIEADRISIEQVDGFIRKIYEFADSLKKFEPDVPLASLKGFIVNKAAFTVDDKVFPEQLARQYGSKTFGVIPVDREVVRVYQRKEFPLEKAPDSDFSYFSVQALDNLISPTLNWTSESSIKRFKHVLAGIRRLWMARKRAEWLQNLIPLFILILVIVSSLSYLLFKKGAVTQYALPTFYITMVIFVLASLIGSILSSLAALRKLEVSKKVRSSIAFASLIVWCGLLYLSAFDIPKTFSGTDLLQRIKKNEELISTEREQRIKAQEDLSNVQAQLSIASAAKNDALAAVTNAQKKYDELQVSYLNAQQQVSTLTIAKNQAQADLATAQRQMDSLNQRISSLQQALADLQKKYSSDIVNDNPTDNSNSGGSANVAKSRNRARRRKLK